MLLCGALLPGCSGLHDFIVDAVLPPQQAAQLGRQMAQQTESQKGLERDAAMQRRVSRVGHGVLASAGELPDAYDFSFKVPEVDQTVNAFALPGGHFRAHRVAAGAHRERAVSGRYEQRRIGHPASRAIAIPT